MENYRYIIILFKNKFVICTRGFVILLIVNSRPRSLLRHSRGRIVVVRAGILGDPLRRAQVTRRLLVDARDLVDEVATHVLVHVFHEHGFRVHHSTTVSLFLRVRGHDRLRFALRLVDTLVRHHFALRLRVVHVAQQLLLVRVDLQLCDAVLHDLKMSQHVVFAWSHRVGSFQAGLGFKELASFHVHDAQVVQTLDVLGVQLQNAPVTLKFAYISNFEFEKVLLNLYLKITRS